MFHASVAPFSTAGLGLVDQKGVPLIRSLVGMPRLSTVAYAGKFEIKL